MPEKKLNYCSEKINNIREWFLKDKTNKKSVDEKKTNFKQVAE